MTMMKTTPLLTLLYLLSLQVDGFTMATRPAAGPPSGLLTAGTQRHVPFDRRGPSFLMMAEDETKTEAKVKADGTYYDDEVEPTKVTTGISQSMKERLAREASTGLDPNAKQTNVILYIIAAVVVLVLLGGQGILY